MKKLVSVTEVEGEGIEAFMGERILVFCMNYFYEGKLVGVSSDLICLEEPHIVYETGAWTDKKYADSQKLHMPVLYIRSSAIESFGASK